MPSRVFLLATIALLVFSLPRNETAAQGAPDSLAVKRLVDEYVKSQTQDDRHREIEKALVDAKPADLSSALKSVFKDENTERKNAYQLALYFQIRGLWSTIEKFLDKEPLLVAAVGLLAEDKGAAATIVKKWKESTPGSDVYAGLGRALLSHGVDVPVIDDVRRIGVDKEATSEHRAAALKMLSYWTGFEVGDPEEISTKYQNYVKPLSNDFKRQPVSGMDLCGRLGWKRDNASRRGRNFRIAQGGTIQNTFTPPGFDRGTIKVTYWVYLDSKEPQGFVGFVNQGMRGGTGLNGVDIVKDKWVVRHEYGDIELACKAQTWHKVMLTAEYRENSCRLGIFVNGKGMYQGGYMDVFIVGVTASSESGEMVVGSIDYQRG